MEEAHAEPFLYPSHIADDDTPSCRPATVKLRVSAARTNALSDPRLSIREPPFRTPVSDMFGIMACFSNVRERSSSAQRRNRPLAGAPIYVGSKHAVEGITKSVALELAKSGIRVNAVAPGPTDTGMLTRFTGTPENKAALTATVPMARLGLTEEIANAIVFVASEGASYITGHVLHVDGGKSH
jgi:Enoyl-(Acyl carrier protein) reductase